jgi:hypothetical protein
VQFKQLVRTELEHRKSHHQSRSKSDRSQLIEALRSACERPDSTVHISTPSSSEIKTKKAFASVFMHPDAMIEVPSDLGTEWDVVLRPAGERCLVILDHNTLKLRSRNGSVVTEFILDPFTLTRHDIFAIFDGIFSGTINGPKISIIDLIVWNKTNLVDSEYTCRRYFLQQNFPFSPVPESAPTIPAEEDIPEIALMESFPVTRANVTKLYGTRQTELGVESDSLLFFRRDGKYEAGLAEDALFFRDSKLSRFCVDSAYADGFEGDEDQLVVLKLVREKQIVFLKSWDNVVMYQCPLESILDAKNIPLAIQEHVKKSSCRRKMFIRTPLERIEDLSKWCVSKKPFPSSFNRIVDQFRKRRAWAGGADDEKPVAIDSILARL